MKRFVIMTVGKTHSGKTTFAKTLEKELANSVVIDQDNHAEFLNTYYPTLFNQAGPNKIKFKLTQTMVDYVVQETNYHIILCNSNYNRLGRDKLLTYYRQNDFTTILVFFDIPDEVLYERVRGTSRSTNILRVAKSFIEVLDRQYSDMEKEEVCDPTANEADFLLTVQMEEDMKRVVDDIVAMVREK